MYLVQVGAVEESIEANTTIFIGYSVTARDLRPVRAHQGNGSAGAAFVPAGKHVISGSSTCSLRHHALRCAPSWVYRRLLHPRARAIWNARNCVTRAYTIKFRFLATLINTSICGFFFSFCFPLLPLVAGLEYADVFGSCKIVASSRQMLMAVFVSRCRSLLLLFTHFMHRLELR